MYSRKLFRVITFIAVTGLASCKDNDNRQPNAEQQKTGNMQPVQQKKKFAGIQFASKTDTTCGMPVAAGIKDTLVLNGKVYGFCATECKNEFEKILKSQHKR